MSFSVLQLTLLLTGVATCLALVLFLFPRQMLAFGFAIRSPQPIIVLMARHWGLLVFLVGALLVYAAFEPAIRVPTLLVAGVEKTVFASLIFLGPTTRTSRIAPAAAVDAVFALLYLICLLAQ
jgi:hypothetical protein